VGGARNGFVGDDEGVSIAAVEQVSFLPSFLPSPPSVRPSFSMSCLRRGETAAPFSLFFVWGSSSRHLLSPSERIVGGGGGMTPSPFCVCVLRIYHRVFVR
jgi:hypothetical protein